MQSFLAQDDAENHPFIANDYDSYRYAMDVFNRARTAGIRSACVTLSFPGETGGYALNAFITSDYGLVYVEEGPDKIACVESGKLTSLSMQTQSRRIGLRNNTWWDSLQTCYYLSSGNDQNLKSVMGNISIYW